MKNILLVTLVAIAPFSSFGKDCYHRANISGPGKNGPVVVLKDEKIDPGTCFIGDLLMGREDLANLIVDTETDYSALLSLESPKKRQYVEIPDGTRFYACQANHEKQLFEAIQELKGSVNPSLRVLSLQLEKNASDEFCFETAVELYVSKIQSLSILNKPSYASTGQGLLPLQITFSDGSVLKRNLLIRKTGNELSLATIYGKLEKGESISAEEQTILNQELQRFIRSPESDNIWVQNVHIFTGDKFFSGIQFL